MIFSFFCYRIHLPGKYYELNIHFGIFVGGLGDFNEIFLGNRENFRGCLDSVYFNGNDVLVKAKVQVSKNKDKIFSRIKCDTFFCLYRRKVSFKA